MKRFVLGISVLTTSCGGGATGFGTNPAIERDADATAPADDEGDDTEETAPEAGQEQAGTSTDSEETETGDDGAASALASGFPVVADSDFAKPGPFATKLDGNAGPDGAFTLVHPVELGKGGLKHPIITWGNGTFMTPAKYAGLLAHLASHGFVVIASNSTMTGNGKEMLAGVDWLLTENQRSGGTFGGKLDPGQVGASGHSQGGGGSLAAAGSPKVKCSVPIQASLMLSGGAGTAKSLKGPTFLIAGETDVLVPVATVDDIFGNVAVPAFFGIKKGAGHFQPMDAADGMRDQITAWFRAHLMGDGTARKIFYGEGCGLCRNAEWTVKRRGL